MTQLDDQQIRISYGSQREEDARHAPSFARLSKTTGVERSSRRKAPLALLASGLGLAAAALLIQLREPSPGETPWPVDLTRTEWIAPTDFLLDLPQGEYWKLLPLTSNDSTRSSL